MDFHSNQPKKLLKPEINEVDNIHQRYEATDTKIFSEKPSCYVKGLEIVDEKSDPQN